MGKFKALIISVIALFVSLVFGLFLIQNKHDILVDLLYKAEPVETSVGRFALGFFGGGLFVGILLCVAIIVLTSMELAASRREVRKLESQLTKLRERSAKDSA